jgi:hypothetical protein
MLSADRASAVFEETTLDPVAEDVLDTPTASNADDCVDSDDPRRVVPTVAMVALKLPEESGTDCCPLKLDTTVVVGSIPLGKAAEPVTPVGPSTVKAKLYGAASAFPPRS